jgi:hypothetical protein
MPTDAEWLIYHVGRTPRYGVPSAVYLLGLHAVKKSPVYLELNIVSTKALQRNTF